jgi:hypothetical protein
MLQRRIIRIEAWELTTARRSNQARESARRLAGPHSVPRIPRAELDDLVGHLLLATPILWRKARGLTSWFAT